MTEENAAPKTSSILLDETLLAVGKRIGLSRDELIEFSFIWMMRMALESPHYTSEAAEAWKDSKENQAAIDTPDEEHPLHPFMERLFCRNQYAVHGPAFGQIGCEEVTLELVTFGGIVKRIMDQDNIESIAAEALGYGKSIIGYPSLKNEAMALITLGEAYYALNDSCCEISRV